MHVEWSVSLQGCRAWRWARTCGQAFEAVPGELGELLSMNTGPSAQPALPCQPPHLVDEAHQRLGLLDAHFKDLGSQLLKVVWRQLVQDALELLLLRLLLRVV